MKNKIKFSLFIFIAAIVTSFAIFKMKIPANLFAESKEQENEATRERQEIAGAAEWWNSIRANQNTHSIDLADVVEARNSANTLLAEGGTRALNFQWEDMGPDNVGGRARALIFDNTNPSHVIAGGVSGGLFESGNYGQSWTRINDFNDGSLWTNQCISAMAQTQNGDIYVGTGEYFGWFTTSVVGGGTGFPGDGVWKSTDHGATWTHHQSVSGYPTTAGYWAFVTSMASGGSTYPDRVYAAVRGTPGVVYTDGSTWQNCTGMTGTGTSVAVGSNGIVHAIVGNKYYRTSTGGTAFSSTGVTGLPATNAVNRMSVAVAPSNANYVYVIAAYSSGANGDLLRGVYKSTDGGTTFTQIAPTQTDNQSVNWSPVTQGGYALALGVSPADPNVVFIGGLDCFKYQLQQNGSYAWNKITAWTYAPWYSLYSHADIHTFIFHPTNPDIMFVGSDGGFSMTTNADDMQPYFGTRNLGFNTVQFYSCDARDYSGVIVAGAQDNGNFRMDFTGNTPQTGVEIKSGDGGDVQVSKVNPLAVFAEYVNGSVERSSNNGQSFLGFFDAHIDAGPSGTPDGEPDEGAAFIAPILLYEDLANQGNANTYSKFFLGTNGNVWMTQQALNYSVTPAWFKINSTALGVVISLAVTPDGKTLFAGSEAGNVWRIDGLDTTYVYDTSGVFTASGVGLTTTLIHSFGRFVTGITVDKSNANHIVVTLGNYGNNDFVYESTDALTGAAFTSITGNLPTMPAYCAAIDPTDANVIVVGTELGVWGTENGGSTWTEQNNTMARVPVTKIRQVKVGNYDNVLHISTYGNGVWRSFSNAVLSTKELTLKTNSIKVYPNPSSGELNFVVSVDWGSENISARLMDATGRIVQSVDYGRFPTGVYPMKIETGNAASGNYILQVISGGTVFTSKVVIVK